jgi:alpha-beta hydrolase superfamily lysophospholipase
MSGSHLEKDMGIVPVDPTHAPFPVVIFFNGFNCDAHRYQWLAVKLAERGLVAVIYNWVAEQAGMIGLTAGVDVEAWKPALYGKAPSASALPAILAKLETLQTKGILAGTLDLKRVILGGHSAGGKVAAENADTRFFPQVAASFSYAGHSAAPVLFGYEAGTILPLPDRLPMLLMGGTRDGVVANSGYRYGMSPEHASTAIARTFEEAISGGRNDCYLVVLEGANHFSIADGFDSAASRAFLDFPATNSAEDIHSLMAEIIGLFILAHVRCSPEAGRALHELLNTANPLINTFKIK